VRRSSSEVPPQASGLGTGTPAMSRDAASRLIPYANPHVPQMAKAPMQSHQEESSVYSACRESGRKGWREKVRG